MKKLVAATMLTLSMTMTASYAFADNAIGIVLGDPSGISGRASLNGQHSIDGALAYATGDHSGLHIHATYLWDRARTFAVQGGGPIEMYYGLGVRLINFNKGEHDGELAIGPRAPLGLLYNINNPDLEFFGEVSVAVDLTPETDVDLDVGVGVRIRF